MSELTRREMLAAAGVATLAGAAPAAKAADSPFRFMFNTATIMGQALPLTAQIDITAKAGYDAFEPWVRDIDAHVRSGKSLRDAAKRIKDAGLTVESAIGFAAWIVDDEAARRKGLEQAKRDMDLVHQLGGKRIAAPPVGASGANDRPVTELNKAADRFAALCEVGEKVGVVPQVELWGHSKTLSRLGETALVAIDCRHPKALILADVFHLHKGGSGFGGLKMLGGPSMQVFHMNDYPAKIGRRKLTDADRVFPGDGDAPLVPMLRDLRKAGFTGYLSLELFNRTYWKQDAAGVAKEGLVKMKAVVAKALA